MASKLGKLYDKYMRSLPTDYGLLGGFEVLDEDEEVVKAREVILKELFKEIRRLNN